MSGNRFLRLKVGRGDIAMHDDTREYSTLKLSDPLSPERAPASPRFRSISLGRHPLDLLLGVPPTMDEIRDGITATAVRRRDAYYRRGLALADVLAATLAMVLGVIVLGGDKVTLAFVAAIPLVVVVSKISGLYDRDEHLLQKTTLEEAPALFQLATLYTLAIWLCEGILVDDGTALAQGVNELGRDQVLGLWALLFVSLIVTRTGMRALITRRTSPERCLVLGSSEDARRVDTKLRGSRSAGAEVVGRVALEPGKPNGPGPAVLGYFDDLDDLVTRYDIGRVIIAPRTSDSEELLDAIRLVKSFGVKVSVLPRLFEVVGSSVRFDEVDGLMLLGVPQWGLTKSSNVIKRSVDILASGLGLLVVAPLLATIAATVKLSSRGPVFFRQTRIGRDGEEFQMLKFRTMYDGADEDKEDLLAHNEADGLFKIADDPRLTDVGRVLRRFSLDELPQLLNVLRGDMSLVGPRPLVVDDDRRVEGWQRRRLDVPPGMTGIWQVLGSSRIPLHEMVKIDYLYGANWSLWLDVKILLRTIPHVVGRRGI